MSCTLVAQSGPFFAAVYSDGTIECTACGQMLASDAPSDAGIALARADRLGIAHAQNCIAA